MTALLIAAAWQVYIPGGVIVVAAVAIVRWLAKIQERVNDHAERIARLEGWKGASDA